MSDRAACLLALASCALAACSFDDGANSAFGCDETCPPGACYLGYCLMRASDSSPDPFSGLAGTSGSAAAGSGAPSSGGTTGSAGSSASGNGSAGMDATGSAGSGAAGTGAPIAGSGGDPSCALGTPATETCNGADDDCNGVIDDLADQPCYPSGMLGCEVSAQGDAGCLGACTAGLRGCQGGVPGACTGYVGPAEEACGGAQATDEDCDGQIDEGCACSGDETQRCYSGPLFTSGIGPCRAGTQRCENGELGACEGEVVPSAETCANQGRDDDCDLIVDDVTGRGVSCIDFTHVGVCRTGTRQCKNGALTCVTPAALADETACDHRDEDCDGAVDEKYDLSSDPQNCGACGTKCGLGQACCAGSCVATNTVDHCGGCGGCAGGQACCDGACVATDTFVHCGGCGGCAGGQACCDHACVGIDSVDHCGGCGGCAAEQACCNRTCVATDTTEHCGGCDACAPGAQCCDRACTDTSSDSNNCSACGVDCGDVCTCQQGECRDEGGLSCL